jgi:hypothetical protein
VILTDPVPFREALQSREIRSLLPTSGRTADFAAIDAATKLRAMFSATVSSVELLQRYDDVIDGILTGKLDQASARLTITKLLEEMGYVADPNNAGGLQDLASPRRVNLTIETNVDIARGFGWREQGMQDDVLFAFPAQELYRAFGTRVPRGSSDRANDLSWPERWEKVGGIFVGDRMVALKTDPIWEKLGDPKIFADGIGNAWPPFAFGSGYDVRDIDRAEAIELDLIDQTTELKPEPVDLNADLAATPDVRSEWLRGALTDSGLGDFDDRGVFHFRRAA